MDPQDIADIDFTIDTENLYREEGFTDLKVASIRRLVPVTAEGADDPSRTPIYVGTTQLMTPNGMLPIEARLAANTFSEAIDQFPDAIRRAVNDLIDEARRYQREEASRIIVPGRENLRP